MRKLWIVLLAWAMTSPVFCAKPVTLDLVDELLLYARQKSDAKVADELFDLELTERVSPARLARWEAELPGPKSRQAMVALADASVFLHPPPDEDPGIGAPRRDKQDAMLALSRTYVTDTIPKLPNFFATRNTTLFSNAPGLNSPRVGNSQVYQGMRLVGTISDKAYFREGKEVIVADPNKQSTFIGNTLSTKGIFGEAIVMVLSDVFPSAPAWYRWEGGTDSPLAVYRYSVALDQSHYAVNATGDPAAVAYHGEIAIDPANGAVRRLTAVAELGQSSPISVANVMVEYGPVDIGGKTYICPVKSVSLAVRRALGSSFAGARPGAPSGPLVIKVNDIQFTDYHRFGAESRILTGSDAAPNP